VITEVSCAVYGCPWRYEPLGPMVSVYDAVMGHVADHELYGDEIPTVPVWPAHISCV
jgi:hypothetical protein